MQPDGQPRTRPKFPPKLRWRARPRSSESPSTGSGAGLRGGSRPRGTSRKVNAEPEPNPGANSWRRTPSAAWWRGSAGHPTSPYTCSARCRAPDTWEPSPGLPCSRRGLATSPGRAPFAPGPPTRKRQRAGAPRGWLPAPLSSSDLCRSREGVSFSSNPPSTLSSFPQPLPCPATSQTDGQETQRRKQNKTKLPPLGSHPPAWSREEEEERAHLSSSSPSRLGYPGGLGQQGTPRWPIEKR